MVIVYSLGGFSHPVIVTIRDNIRVLLFSECVAVDLWGMEFIGADRAFGSPDAKKSCRSLVLSCIIFAKVLYYLVRLICHFSHRGISQS